MSTDRRLRTAQRHAAANPADERAREILKRAQCRAGIHDLWLIPYATGGDLYSTCVNCHQPIKQAAVSA